MLEIKGCLVTIDAMGCQVGIARKIVESKADYVLAVKANQKTMYGSIRRRFEAWLDNGFDGTKVRKHQTKE